MYEDLIQAYSQLNNKKDTVHQETIFDICRFPHYENVISNVLAFFFDETKPHGLGSMLVNALLQTIQHTSADDTGGWLVEREVRTSSGKFIDLVLQNDNLVIIIENKVWAGLYNDLEDYLNFVRKENPEKKVQGIVLTLNELSTDMNDFEVVKYDTFLHHVKKELGVNLANANYKYIYLLLDVMENMKNLKEGNKVDEKLVSFISKNESKIKDFVGDLKKYQAELRRTVNEVNNLVEEEVNGVKVKKWATRNINELYDIAVVDIELVNNVRIAIDSVIDHNGWRHEVFQRERGYNSDSFNLEQYCNERNIKVESINGRKHILSEKHPFNTGKQEIANKINSLLDRLTKGTYK